MNDQMAVNEDNEVEEPMEEGEKAGVKEEEKPKEVYLPGKPLEEGEELVCDKSAYVMFHQAQTGAPCLSFDVVRDGLGENRDTFPLTTYIVAGTQASQAHTNSIIVMKFHNLHKLDNSDSDDDDDDEESDDEDASKSPQMAGAIIKHHGCINRIRCTDIDNTVLVASWSELGRVNIWDVTQQLHTVNDAALLARYNKEQASNAKPLFTFSGHRKEGFAMDWSTTVKGNLATGDCHKDIHIWRPAEGGTWNVNQTPLVGHTASVEDLQWSPNEATVLASCSVDKSIRIWDIRAPPSKACMLKAENAHQSDVNVISWNRVEPFIVSGGDDGVLHVWDLRRFQSGVPVATFKHHTEPVTTVEWHPTDTVVFASGGSDNQIALWDLSVEKDSEAEEENIENIPPQLLFIHQGQSDIKELHWHPQIPGVIISTAHSGFNIFRTISDVENSRSYIDDLYSSDAEKCLTSLKCIKNSVIGSNRQKEHVITQGIVPRLIQLLKDRDNDISLRLEAAVTIGSLAKGTEKHVEILVNCGTIPILLDILEENNSLLTDPCLRCLRTLSFQDVNDFKRAFTLNHIQRLLSYANNSDSVLQQSCAASILSSVCKGTVQQNLLNSAGAAQVFANMLEIEHSAVRLPTLTCIAAMCFENRMVASDIANCMYKDTKIPNMLILLMSREKPIEMQLEAARCLTNLHRAGAISAQDPLITFRTLPCLVRLCQGDHAIEHKAAAANTLGYLTEVDSDLQQTAAISNQLVGALADMLNSSSNIARQAAFRAFGSLGANDEDIRKRIIEASRLMERIVEGLSDPDQNVRIAAVMCLHSLSRSVQQLRTTFQDHSVWQPLMALLTGNPPVELLSAASSALCNLLLEFSPAKERMLQQGAVQLLATLTTRPEPALRLNGVWALMNLAFQAEKRVKSQILTALGTDQIFRLLADPDTSILMKTLGLLRNLVSPRAHTDSMMNMHGPQVMQAVVLVLEGPHLPDVKEQALCILANIADGERAKDHIMANEDVLKKLTDYMTHQSTRLQAAAIYCLGNLVRRGEPGAAERQQKLKEMGILNILHQLVSTPDSLLFDKVKTAMTQFTEV